jgi:hypothetical protein
MCLRPLPVAGDLLFLLIMVPPFGFFQQVDGLVDSGQAKPGMIPDTIGITPGFLLAG